MSSATGSNVSDSRKASKSRLCFWAFAKTNLLFALLAVVGACDLGPKRSAENRINEEVLEKLAGWQARRDRACRNSAMEIAVARADSMILAFARENKLQLERPSRPIRPEEPALQRPNDTLELAPFLADTL